MSGPRRFARPGLGRVTRSGDDSQEPGQLAFPGDRASDTRSLGQVLNAHGSGGWPLMTQAFPTMVMASGRPDGSALARLGMLAIIAALTSLVLVSAVWGAGFSSTAPMTVARYAATATLLPSGKVLVAGGQGAAGYLASAEIYDPATNAWNAIGAARRASWLRSVSRDARSTTELPQGRHMLRPALASRLMARRSRWSRA